MFTGIIDRVGSVRNIEPGSDSVSLVLQTGYEDLALGESVAVNGICLTVTETSQGGECQFFASHETLARTNLGALVVGSAVNLERALQANGRISGHIVQGHVDGKARFVRAVPGNQSHDLFFELPNDLARYCIPKGSIAINGVSLTINGIIDSSACGTTITVTIIPHTWEHTNLSHLRPGDAVNVEVDVLAKYVERLCQTSPLLLKN